MSANSNGEPTHPEQWSAGYDAGFKDGMSAKLEQWHRAMRGALDAMELHAKQYPHMQKGYTVDAIADLRKTLALGPNVRAETPTPAQQR